MKMRSWNDEKERQISLKQLVQSQWHVPPRDVHTYIVKRLRDTAAQEVLSRFDEVVQMSWIESTFWKDLVRFCAELIQDAVGRYQN